MKWNLKSKRFIMFVFLGVILVVALILNRFFLEVLAAFTTYGYLYLKMETDRPSGVEEETIAAIINDSAPSASS